MFSSREVANGLIDQHEKESGDENKRLFSNATSGTDSLNGESSLRLIGEVEKLFQNKDHTVLMRIYQQAYGQPHPRKGVHCSTLVKGIKKKL